MDIDLSLSHTQTHTFHWLTESGGHSGLILKNKNRKKDVPASPSAIDNNDAVNRKKTCVAICYWSLKNEYFDFGNLSAQWSTAQSSVHLLPLGQFSIQLNVFR